MIPVIIMGGILSGWFTPTEAGVVAVATSCSSQSRAQSPTYMEPAARHGCLTGLLYSLPLITIGAASAFGWMLAYLRGPAVMSEWIASTAGNDPVHDHVAAGATVHHRRRFHRPGAGNHHLHAAGERRSPPTPISIRCTWGSCMIATLAFGLITPPYGLVLLMASKFVGVRFSRQCSPRCRSTSYSLQPLPSASFFPRSCSGCPSSAADFGRLLPKSKRDRAISAT